MLTPTGEKWVDERRRVAAASFEAIDAVRASPAGKLRGVQTWCDVREEAEIKRANGQDPSLLLRALARNTAAGPFADRLAIRHAERRVDAAIEREQARGHDGRTVRERFDEGAERHAAIRRVEETTSSAAVRDWASLRASFEADRTLGQDVSRELRALARWTASLASSDRLAIRQAERRVEAEVERELQARGHKRGGGVSERPVAVTAMAAARAAREAAEEVRRREDAPSAAVREWASRREAIEDLRAVGEDVSRDMRQLARETAARPFADRIAIRHAEQRVESAVQEHTRGHER